MDFSRKEIQKMIALNRKPLNLVGANLEGVDLSSLDLREANLRRVILKGATLREADLSGADLSYCDMEYADLSLASLNSSFLAFTNLRNSNLNGTDFKNAIIIDSIASKSMGQVDSCSLCTKGGQIKGIILTHRDGISGDRVVRFIHYNHSRFNQILDAVRRAGLVTNEID